MSGDRFRRTRLGALAGVVALTVCLPVATAPGALARRAAVQDTRSPTPSPKPSASIGKGEGTLQVLTYQGHVEYGGATASADWLSPFEKLTGCRVSRLDRVHSGEEMAEKVRSASYDVISASPDLAGRLIADGAVRPLDTTLLRSYKDIPRRLRELPATRDASGKVYGVPYLWGTNQVIREPGAPDGPDAVYRTEQSAVRDTPLSIADAALALRRTRPELGVKDPYQLTPAQLDAAVGLLAEHDGPRRVYWTSTLEVIQAFSTGEAHVAQALPYHLDLFERAGRTVEREKGPVTGWADAWMVGTGATSPNCAYKWLNWVGSADTQHSAAAWTGLAPANVKACDGEVRRLCDAYHARDDRELGRVLFAARPTKDCGGSGGECTDYTEWEKRWKDLVK
ncbi:extracellular solute-binding protein [Streptosporangium jomthongense]|uniref:Extracellular solute-binding protein n=1 Tax=Streptosporangium jomthongense TaxID=1193683 RepID=A0ABV8EYG3_9ACTN